MKLLRCNARQGTGNTRAVPVGPPQMKKEPEMGRTGVVRVPEGVHLEAKQIAQLRGQQPGEVIAEAWQQYMAENRSRFAADLEEAAELLRNGSTEDLAKFASRNARDRAEAAAARLRDPS
jgi:hypothetical protein